MLIMSKSILIIITFIPLLIPTLVLANENIIKSWKCMQTYHTNVLIIANVYEGRKTGQILLDGVKYSAKYMVSGNDRVWIFGTKKEGKGGYLFQLEPTGVAYYYNFTDTKPNKPVNPSLNLSCKTH